MAAVHGKLGMMPPHNSVSKMLLKLNLSLEKTLDGTDY
jgi:hypothetical protein